MKKEAQAWGFDLMIASAIFLGGIILFYVYSLNYPAAGQETLDKLTHDGGIIADSLLSEGFPINWEASNVVKIGLLSNEKINESKLETLYNMVYVNGEYEKTRAIFNTRYHYFFNFSETIDFGSGPIAEGGIGNQPFVTTNLIKINRFTIYKNMPVSVNLYIWE